MIKRLLQVGLILVSGFVAMPGWAISINDGGFYDGTNVGIVDTFLAEAAKAGNPTAEEVWVNSILNVDGITATFTVKTEPVTYFATDMTGVFAFALDANFASDYFLVKNAKNMALFKNLADINWGVFDSTFLSGDINLPTSPFEISHVSQYSSTAVPEPGLVGLLAAGLLGMIIVRRKMKV